MYAGIPVNRTLGRNPRWLICAAVLALGLGSFTFITAAGAQEKAARSATIGYLGNSSPSLESNLLHAFREGLRERGYVEGQNLVIKYQWAEGRQERHAALVQELVRLKPDLIVTAGTPATLAAKQATQSIPIVAAGAGDAVAAGLVSSLAKPGGNVTGVSTLAPDLEGKRLELFKQAVPTLSRIAVLLNPDNPYTAIAWKALQPTARALGLTLQPVEARSRDDLEGALATIKDARPDGLIVIPDRFLLAYRAPTMQFVARNRVPAMFPFREFAQDGGLMAYGPDYADVFRRAATYVDRILKGAKPAELAVEQPTKFELVINIKSAQALGLKIPASVLARADETIR
jgi:putative ABC transport system substrate-binding protein